MNNNTIALLTGIFIVVLLSTFMISPKGLMFVTGKQTIAPVTFNITSEASILVSGDIQFRGGRVDAGAPNATLDSSLGSTDFAFADITSGVQPSSILGTIVFDNNRGVFVMFGSLWNETANDTWEYDYPSNTWSLISTDVAPPGSFLGSMVYDSSVEKVILFGGFKTGLVIFNDTWSYNGSNWTKMDPVVAPPKINSASMVFDSIRNRTVLFGGGTVSFSSLNKTWVYNYSGNNWTDLNIDGPSKRSGAGALFDPVRDKMVLFGGNTEGGHVDEVWEFDGSAWTDVTGSVTGMPSGVQNYVVMYDSGRDKYLVMVVYQPNNLYNVEVWDYDPDIRFFSRIYDVNAADWISTINFDSLNNVTVFSGRMHDITNGSTFYNETWVLNYSASTGILNGTWDFNKDYIFVENDGTVNVSVNFSANPVASNFIGGSNPSFQLKGVVSESGACPDLNISYQEVTGPAQTELCPLLKFGYDEDEFRVAAKLVVPADITSGSRTSTITFAATGLS